MAMYTDFFVAAPSDIPTMRFPEDLRARPVVLANGITPDAVAELDFLLTGNRTREPVCVRDEGELSVYRLDDELVSALARLDRSRMNDVADEWGISDSDSTRELLAQLRTLADQATSRNEAVFLYF